MNQLARFIHSLVAEKDVAQLSALSQGERAAITNLKSLLALSPGELAGHLEEGSASDWWPPLIFENDQSYV